MNCVWGRRWLWPGRRFPWRWGHGGAFHLDLHQLTIVRTTVPSSKNIWTLILNSFLNERREDLFDIVLPIAMSVSFIYLKYPSAKNAFPAILLQSFSGGDCQHEGRFSAYPHRDWKRNVHSEIASSMPGRVPGFACKLLNQMLTTLLWCSLVTLTPTL